MTEPTWEVRIARVLCDGVPPTICEKGAPRCFYVLVKNRRIIPLLSELLDDDATVDGIDGASAGENS